MIYLQIICKNGYFTPNITKALCYNNKNLDPPIITPMAQLLDLIPQLPEHIRDSIYEFVEADDYYHANNIRQLHDIYPKDIRRYLLAKCQDSIMDLYEKAHCYEAYIYAFDNEGAHEEFFTFYGHCDCCQVIIHNDNLNTVTDKNDKNDISRQHDFLVCNDCYSPKKHLLINESNDSDS